MKKQELVGVVIKSTFAVHSSILGLMVNGKHFTGAATILIID